MRDLGASREWYREVLGMERRFEDEWGEVPTVMCLPTAAGDECVALFPVEGSPKPPPGRDVVAMRHFAWRGGGGELRRGPGRFRGAGGGSGSTTYTVDTTSDATFNGCSLADNDCSLRGAINNANFGGSSSDVINFDAADFPAGAPATIAIATALPALTDGNDTINATGTGVIIDAVN